MPDSIVSEKQAERAAALVDWFRGRMERIILEEDETMREVEAFGPDAHERFATVEEELAHLDSKIARTLPQMKEEARRHLGRKMTDRAFDRWLHKRCCEYYAPHYVAMLADFELQAPAFTRLSLIAWLRRWEDQLNQVNEDAGVIFGIFVQFVSDELDQFWPRKYCPEFPPLKAALMFQGKPVRPELLKIGGKLQWVQGASPPFCGECEGEMAMMVELKALPDKLAKKLKSGRAYDLGDSGTVWLFGCQDCLRFEAVWQCY